MFRQTKRTTFNELLPWDKVLIQFHIKFLARILHLFYSKTREKQL